MNKLINLLLDIIFTLILTILEPFIIFFTIATQDPDKQSEDLRNKRKDLTTME